MEDKLLSLLSVDELFQLKLPTTALKPILRPLPRHVHRHHPTQSQLKPSFSNFIEIQRAYLDSPLLHLYASQKLTFPISIVLFTWVIVDGLGDYYAQVEMAKILKTAFGNHAVTTVTCLHHNCRLPPHAPSPDYLLHYNGKLNEPIIYETLNDPLLFLLQTCDLILEFPTPFPHATALQTQIGHRRYERLGEHSLIESIHYQPATQARCMGLHFLEKGILIKKIPKPNPTPIHQLLNLPQSLENTSFNFGYTKTFRGTYLYLLTLLYATKPEPRDLSICFVNMPLFSHVIENLQKNHTLLSSLNIKKIQILSHPHIATIPISPNGKTLHLIHSSQLPQPLLTELMQRTDHLIGCTGDQSVLEAIATKRPFFYDPPHFKRPFLKDLHAIAQHDIPGPLAEFFRLSLKNPRFVIDETDDWVSQDYVEQENALLSLTEESDEAIAAAMGQLLQTPQLQQGFEKLHARLAIQYDIQPNLIGLVQRAILHHRNPQLHSGETSQLNAFTYGTQNAFVTLSNIHQLLPQSKF